MVNKTFGQSMVIPHVNSEENTASTNAGCIVLVFFVVVVSSWAFPHCTSFVSLNRKVINGQIAKHRMFPEDLFEIIVILHSLSISYSLFLLQQLALFELKF